MDGGVAQGGGQPEENPGRRRVDGNLRPPLKWAGGKRWLLPHLRPLWESHSSRHLIEPLCGGLAVAMGLRPARTLLNDITPRLEFLPLAQARAHRHAADA